MRDRASVNGAALNIVKIMYPNLFEVGCLSHMLNLVGERFKTPTLILFIAHWIALFSHSYKSKHCGKKQQDELWHHILKLVGGVDGR